MIKKYIENVDNLSINELFEIKGGAIADPYGCEDLACKNNACKSEACKTTACKERACGTYVCSVSTEGLTSTLTEISREQNVLSTENMLNSILIR